MIQLHYDENYGIEAATRVMKEKGYDARIQYVID